MADEKMTITKENVTSLDPTAVAKFATASEPGRVLNVAIETAGSGVGEFLFKHPDGTVVSLVSATVPKLAAGETLYLRARIRADIRKPAKVDAEIG